jgi:hypothetical protein
MKAKDNKVWNKEELPQEWKESIIVPFHKKGDRMDCNNYRNFTLVYLLYIKFFRTYFYREWLHMQIKL